MQISLKFRRFFVTRSVGVAIMVLVVFHYSKASPAKNIRFDPKLAFGLFFSMVGIAFLGLSVSHVVVSDKPRIWSSITSVLFFSGILLAVAGLFIGKTIDRNNSGSRRRSKKNILIAYCGIFALSS